MGVGCRHHRKPTDALRSPLTGHAAPSGAWLLEGSLSRLWCSQWAVTVVTQGLTKRVLRF